MDGAPIVGVCRCGPPTVQKPKQSRRQKDDQRNKSGSIDQLIVSLRNPESFGKQRQQECPKHGPPGSANAPYKHHAKDLGGEIEGEGVWTYEGDQMCVE